METEHAYPSSTTREREGGRTKGTESRSEAQSNRRNLLSGITTREKRTRTRRQRRLSHLSLGEVAAECAQWPWALPQEISLKCPSSVVHSHHPRLGVQCPLLAVEVALAAAELAEAQPEG